MGIPAPKGGSGTGNGAPFLKVMHVSKKGNTVLTFLGKSCEVRDGQFGEQILIPIKIGPKEYTFAVKVDSGNHSRLWGRFGADDKKWKGKVNVRVAEHMGNDYIQVVD